MVPVQWCICVLIFYFIGVTDERTFDCLLNLAFCFSLPSFNRQFRSSLVTRLIDTVMAVPPEDVNEAVLMIPADLFPYGRDCHISTPMQSILHHYEVTPASAEIIEAEEFFKIRDVRMADPDGDDAAKAFFQASICNRVASRMQQMKIRLAFRRALRPDPFAPVVAAPASSAVLPRPAKRPRTAPASASSAGAAGVAAAGAPVAHSSSAPDPPAASSQASASSTRVVSDLFGSSDEEEDDILGVVVEGDGGADADPGAAGADDAGEDKTKLTVQKNVVTLFNDLANEVFAFWKFVNVMPFFCSC